MKQFRLQYKLIADNCVPNLKKLNLPLSIDVFISLINGALSSAGTSGSPVAHNSV